MMSDFNLEHLIHVISKNMQRLRKEFKHDEFCNNTVLRMYNYLESRQLKSGSIYDNNAKSVLDFQYHTAYYILSSLLVYYLTTDGRYLENARLSLRHLVKLGYDVNRRANSFIGIALGLSFLFCENTGIRDEIVSYIEKVVFYPEIHQPKKSANNFYALKSLALLLRYISLQKKEDENEGKRIIQSYLVNWQYPDGFFYDSPFEKNVKDGIPHLTYHATMTMVIIFCSILLEDQALLAKGEKGLSALRAVTSPNGEAFSYGRSNNALFGFANAILACSLMAYCNPEKEANIDQYRCQLLHFVLRHQNKDGHLYIVPNSHEGARYGFDKYMFVTVYESYGLSMILLSHLIAPFDKEQMIWGKNEKYPKVFIGQNSGFVTYKTKFLSMGMNVIGHQKKTVEYVDPRLTGGVPLWLCYSSEDILPTIPFTDGLTTGRLSKLPLGVTMGDFANNVMRWSRNPPFSAGFLPYLENREFFLVFLGASEWGISDWKANGINISMLGPLWFVSAREWDIIVFTIRELWKKWLKNPPKSKSSKVFRKSSYLMQRNVLIDRNAVYFRDRIFELNLARFDFVPFSLRTYGSTIVETKEKYFLFEDIDRSLTILVSREKDEYVELKTELGSSKGPIRLWNINCNTGSRLNSKRIISTDHLIMFRKKNTDVEGYAFEKELEYRLEKARANFLRTDMNRRLAKG